MVWCGRLSLGNLVFRGSKSLRYFKDMKRNLDGDSRRILAQIEVQLLSFGSYHLFYLLKNRLCTTLFAAHEVDFHV